MNRHDPFVGFGDDTNTSIKFSLVHDGSGRLPDWEGGQYGTNDIQLANGGVIVQTAPVPDPWTVTWTLLLDDIATLDLLTAVQGSWATLRYLYGVTSTVGGTVEPIFGTRYLKLPDTQLKAVNRGSVRVAGQKATVEVTFLRHATAASYYDFAYYAEDEP